MAYEDSQQHMLECQTLKPLLKSRKVAEENIEYDDLFRDSKKQKAITCLFKHILEARNKLKEESQLNQPDPCTTTSEVMESSIDLCSCIDIHSSVK